MICDSTNTATTFTTEACQSEVGEVPYVGKVKTDLLIIKENIEHLERVVEKFPKNYFTFTIASMAIVALNTGILQFLSNAKHMRN